MRLFDFDFNPATNRYVFAVPVEQGQTILGTAITASGVGIIDGPFTSGQQFRLQVVVTNFSGGLHYFPNIRADGLGNVVLSYYTGNSSESVTARWASRSNNNGLPNSWSPATFVAGYFNANASFTNDRVLGDYEGMALMMPPTQLGRVFFGWTDTTLRMGATANATIGVSRVSWP